jgi:hypothetical protein
MSANPVELADQLARAARNLQLHTRRSDLTGKSELPTPAPRSTSTGSASTCSAC